MLTLAALRPVRTLTQHYWQVSKATALCSTIQNNLFDCIWLKQCQMNSRLQSSAYAEKKGFLHSVKSKLFRALTDKTKLTSAGILLYEVIGDDINHIQFMKFFKLPDTFQSWFLSIQLHVWMCIVMTIGERNGRAFRNVLVDAMWHDVELRMNKLGDMKRSQAKKYLSELEAQFHAALISFDEGILSDDMTLAASAWRTLFSFQNVDPQLLENIVAYIRIQMSHLDGQNLEQMMYHGKVCFKPLDCIFSNIKK